MPRATREQQAQERERERERGGESGDPRELEVLTGSGMNGGPRQPLPPLQQPPPLMRRSEELRQAYEAERQEQVDALPTPKRYRVTKLPREDGKVVGRDGRSFKLTEGKELDERYFDVPGLKKQGVKFELVKDEEGPTA